MTPGECEVMMDVPRLQVTVHLSFKHAAAIAEKTAFSCSFSVAKVIYQHYLFMHNNDRIILLAVTGDRKAFVFLNKPGLVLRPHKYFRDVASSVNSLSVLARAFTFSFFKQYLLQLFTLKIQENYLYLKQKKKKIFSTLPQIFYMLKFVSSCIMR